MSDENDRLRRKIRFRAMRRGTREADLILGKFVESYLHDLESEHLISFEDLLTQNDQDVLSWISETAPAPPEFRTQLLDMLIAFKKVG